MIWPSSYNSFLISTPNLLAPSFRATDWKCTIPNSLLLEPFLKMKGQMTLTTHPISEVSNPSFIKEIIPARTGKESFNKCSPTTYQTKTQTKHHLPENASLEGFPSFSICFPRHWTVNLSEKKATSPPHTQELQLVAPNLPHSPSK